MKQTCSPLITLVGAVFFGTEGTAMRREQLPMSAGPPRRPGPGRAPAPAILLVFLLASNLILPTTCAAQGRQLFRIGTGGTSAVYFPIGKLIAQGLTEFSGKKSADQPGGSGLSDYIGVAQSSGGSVANVRALVAGEIEAGLVQADVASWAYKGEQVFSGEESTKVVRAVASLYPEKLQIVTRGEAGIRSVLDLRGKRISIDEVGSGTLMVMRIVLDAYGLSEKELLPVYLKPEFIDDKMVRGELQGFVVMAGVPMAAVKRVVDLGLFFVPIDREMALGINAKHPYLVPGEIPTGVYPEVPETPTLQVHALLVVNSAMPQDLVYQVTAALWSEQTLSLLKAGHPQGKAITLPTALKGISIPLHPGAERFYREHGMLQAGTSVP